MIPFPKVNCHPLSGVQLDMLKLAETQFGYFCDLLVQGDKSLHPFIGQAVKGYPQDRFFAVHDRLFSQPASWVSEYRLVEVRNIPGPIGM